jgi:hypothetical protein
MPDGASTVNAPNKPPQEPRPDQLQRNGSGRRAPFRWGRWLAVVRGKVRPEPFSSYQNSMPTPLTAATTVRLSEGQAARLAAAAGGWHLASQPGSIAKT